MKIGLLLAGIALAVGAVSSLGGPGGWLLIVMALALGLACAVRLRPTAKALWPPGRWPSASELVAVILGLLAAFETIVLVILLLRIVVRLVLDRLIPAEAVHAVFVLLGLVLALLPTWRWWMSPADSETRRMAPLGALFAAQMAGAFFASALWITWGQLSRLDLGGLLTWQPSIWLFATVMGLTWRRAWSEQDEGFPRAKGLVGAGLKGVQAAFAVLMVGGIGLLYLPPSHIPGVDQSALPFVLASMAFPMMAWLLVFHVMMRREPAANRAWFSPVTLATIAVALTLSLLLPASLVDAHVRVGGLFLLSLPLNLVTCIFIGIIGLALWLINPA